MKFLKTLLFVLIFSFLALLAVTIIVNNKELVDLNMLFMSTKVKLGLAILLAFVFGWFIGIVSMFLPWLKRANKVRVLNKKLAISEKEVKNLRQLPMSDSGQG